VIPARGIADITWHGTRLQQPPWGDAGARVLAFTIAGSKDGEADLHAVLNMSQEALEAEIPELPGRAWHIAVDTARSAPRDIVEPAQQAQIDTRSYQVTPRSVVVLEARAL
jgi:glycogen operon protein